MKTNFYKAALWSGIIAAVVMLILELILNSLFLGAPVWGPPRMMGAILLGKDVLPPPGTFDFGVVMAAMAVHIPLSIIYALVIGLLIRKVSVGMGILFGAIIGLLIYFINFYGFTAIFSWFANARNWVQIVIHILFGVSAAWPFKAMYKIETETEK